MRSVPVHRTCAVHVDRGQISTRRRRSRLLKRPRLRIGKCGSTMWVKIGAALSTCPERGRNGEIRRFTILAHARTTLIGEGARKWRHLVCEVDVGESSATTIHRLHDTVGVKVAVKVVFADPSSDTEEQEG